MTDDQDEAGGSGGGIRGRTGRMRLPKEESWGTKKPTEFVFAA